MKTQTSRNFPKTTYPALLVAAMFSVFAVFPCRVIAQPDYQKMTIESMVQVYRDIENELLRRFETQAKSADRELVRTSQALVHIQSRKAVLLMLRNIEVIPGEVNEKVGDFYPVRTRVGTYRRVYVMLGFLVSLGGIPLEQCIAELEKAQDGALRETLLAHLAQELHGKAFMDEVRSRAASQDGKEKWGRLLNQMLKAQESAPQQR
jgi:hypothetical protein